MVILLACAAAPAPSFCAQPRAPGRLTARIMLSYGDEFTGTLVSYVDGTLMMNVDGKPRSVYWPNVIYFELKDVVPDKKQRGRTALEYGKEMMARRLPDLAGYFFTLAVKMNPELTGGVGKV